MIPAILHYATREELAGDLAEIVARELSEAIAARGRASLAVPGGTTPGPFLTRLGAEDVDWQRVAVMLTDERFVPESSERSNTRLLKGTIFAGPARAARFLPFYMPAERPEDVLERIGGPVAEVLPLDVCVLGMGEDMHTASLFPGADLLDKALADDAPVLLPMRAPGAPEPRLTLTAPVLRGARSLHLLITGEAKKVALEGALADGPEAAAPVRAVLRGRTPVTVHYAD